MNMAVAAANLTVGVRHRAAARRPFAARASAKPVTPLHAGAESETRTHSAGPLARYVMLLVTVTQLTGAGRGSTATHESGAGLRGSEALGRTTS